MGKQVQILPKGIPANYAISQDFDEETINRIRFITDLASRRFRSFGGGSVSPDNPISHALKDRPPQFAAGVDIQKVVEFVVEHLKGMEDA